MKLKFKIKKKTEPDELVRGAKYSHFSASLLQLLAGVSLTVFSEMSNQTMAKVLAAMFILVGATKLLGYFSNDLYKLAFQFDMAIGVFVTVFGVLLLVRPGSFLDALPKVMGLYIILDGVLKLQTAFDARRFGIRFWSVIMATALLVGVMGVLVSLEIMGSARSEIVLLGASLAIDGAENAWVTMATVKVRVKKKNVEDRYGDACGGK